MSAAAIVMMVISILIIWGGLALAIWNLSVHGTADEDDALVIEAHRNP